MALEILKWSTYNKKVLKFIKDNDFDPAMPV